MLRAKMVTESVSKTAGFSCSCSASGLLGKANIDKANNLTMANTASPATRARQANVKMNTTEMKVLCVEMF